MKNKPEIKVTPPGKKARKIIAMDEKYIATSTKCSPIVAKKGKGVYIEDVDGNVYLDFATGVSVLNTGHCHPEIVKSIKMQTSELMHFAGTDFYYEIQTQLAKKLTEITPGKFSKKVFFTNSGTESVEAAIKIARWSTQRKRFVSFINAFHGRTMGSLALTGSRVIHKERFFPLIDGVEHIPYAYCYRCPYKQEYPDCDIWCAKILEEIYFDTILPPEEIAGIFVEPIQGEGGYIVPPKEFLQILKKISKKYGILFIVDEVQSGLGRTGKMFGIEHFDVIPDIVTVAKALGSGIPIGATIFNEKYDFKVKGAHSNTFGGNLVGCASALSTINVIKKDKLVKNAQIVGEYFRKRLLELYDKYENIGDVRGLGLMLATEFVENRKTKKYAVKLRDRIIESAYKNGLILLPCGRSTIRYIPPLNISTREIDFAVDILNKCIREHI